MNARIKDKPEPDNFKPFTLEIDVDTLDDLKYIYMLFNAPVDVIVQESGYDNASHVFVKPSEVAVSKHNIRSILNDILMETHG
jgi:hypothetical protein